jgi:hypothetical protein
VHLPLLVAYTAFLARFVRCKSGLSARHREKSVRLPHVKERKRNRGRGNFLFLYYFFDFSKKMMDLKSLLNNIKARIASVLFFVRQ